MLGGRKGEGAVQNFWQFENFTLKITINIVELQIKGKKIVLGIFISNFATYTRLDILELQKKSKKKGLSCFKWVIAFLNSLKGAILKF